MGRTLGFLRLSCLAMVLAGIPPAAAQRELLPGILGADDRLPKESAEWPWSAIGRVNRAIGGFCTGTMVGPRHVLTAAHCLFGRGGRPVAPDDIHFVAGYRKGEYLAHSVARTVILPEGYRPEEALDLSMMARDWAILVLEKELPIRPVQVRAIAGESGPLLRAGYSQDRAHLLAVHDGCEASGPARNADVLLHTCDATRGDSGSPLLVRDEGGYAIVGIDVGAGETRDGLIGVAVPALHFAGAVETAVEGS